MTPASYFALTKNQQFHDLTEGKSIPAAAASILGLGLNFIPVPKFTTSADEAEPSFARLERDVGLKTFFAGKEDKFAPTKLYVKSIFQPPLPPPEIDNRLCVFIRELKKIISKKQGHPNLTPFQLKLLNELRADDSIVYAHADKGLGPVGVSLKTYIAWALKHLFSPTYELITEEQGRSDIEQLRKEIYQWTFEHRKALTDSAVKFIRKKLDETIEDPYGYFYLMPKLHKTPLKTRPVCSDCASLPHALGQWVDEMLQPIVKTQPTYFKNSFALKKELDELTLPANASLFTYDAVSMYTNINTEDCISRLEAYLLKPQVYSRFQHYSPRALIDAIKIVMRNNRMRFGDLLVKQLIGIAMGMSPAPTIANLFVAIHENQDLLPFLETCLKYLKRFIDDGIGIWLHDANPITDENNWQTFKQAVNNGGLTWEFTKRCKSVVFMDMTIEIENGKIVTSLYAKPLALYLYIPPHSCHSPGVHTGTIFGNILRIFQLCSRDKDIDKELSLFYERLLDRGHQQSTILPLFEKAISNAIKYLSQNEAYRQQQKAIRAKSSKRRVFFHLPYHPNNPPSSKIQKLWRDIVFEPRGKTPLNLLTNLGGHPIPIDQLTICYSRAPNLGNLLSYRKIGSRKGSKVSSFI